MEVSESETDNFKVPLASSKAVPSVTTNLKKTQPEKLPRKCDQNVPLPYEEPTWAATPPENVHFEVLKSGVIISNYSIEKSRVVIGRLTTCDIALEHPSVSRYHAILQYCSGADGHAKGFYVYDLGSTHGTFLNKNQIKAKTYYMVKNGHVLKFGGSTRLHILTGGDSDDEADSEAKLPEKPAAPVTVEDEVCDWGIGEDAEDEGEDEMSENPFALSTENEQLYIDDPKKTLRGWFEREGYELEYNVEEKGFRTFVCTVRLPIDTPTGDYLNVEASVNGKKKEAVIACALEACRTLDRHGLLRQSHQGSRERKRKNWEDEDFYDSDEDVYLDRTGTIEKKRQIRMKLSKKPEPETFGSLSKKLDELNVEVSEVERKLQMEISNSLSSNLNEDDPLDSFMSGINRETVDKVTKSKLRLDLAELLKERTRLEKLLNIVKPADLPVKKFPGMIGKKSKSKLKLPVPQTSKKTLHEESEHPEVEEEIEEEEVQDELAEAKNSTMNSNPSSNVSTEPCNSDEIINPIVNLPLEPCKPDDTVSSTASLGPCTSDSITSLEEEKIHCETKPDKNFLKTVKDEPSSSNVKVLQKADISSTSDAPSKSRAKKGKSKTSKTNVYNAADENYSMWMPPVNQSGDGTTHLNSRYGY